MSMGAYMNVCASVYLSLTVCLCDFVRYFFVLIFIGRVYMSMATYVNVLASVYLSLTVYMCVFVCFVLLYFL